MRVQGLGNHTFTQHRGNPRPGLRGCYRTPGRVIVDLRPAKLGPRRVLFFGSRVARTARERSDFDVAIDGSEPVDPRLFAQICDSLDDLPTLYRVDLVDLTTVSDTVRAEMLSHNEVIL